MMNRKLITSILSLLMIGGMFSGCNSTSSATPTSSSAAPEGNSFDTSRMITVVSREDGSGTRGAFIELMGIQEKKEDGTKVDNTTKEAVIAPKTDVMLTNVAGDDYAIGYVSLGSLNNFVKALSIDGVAATAETVKNTSYKVARPFQIATKGEPTGLSKDFIAFIMSAEGQEIIEKGGYIKVVDDAPAFAGALPEGKIVIAGSSSVSPIIEKLKEAYCSLNPKASIEVQQSDSSSGMQAAIDGTCDIGMASRDLKDSELEALSATAIANDGIAIIVAPGNTTDGLTSEQVKNIFTGAVETWADIK